MGLLFLYGILRFFIPVNFSNKLLLEFISSSLIRINLVEILPSSLKITDVQLGKGGAYNLVADLTIRGKTFPVLFDANIKIDKKSVSAKSKIVFDRTKYDIKYKSKKFFDPKVLGDKLIYDDVELKVELKANK